MPSPFWFVDEDELPDWSPVAEEDEPGYSEEAGGCLGVVLMFALVALLLGGCAGAVDRELCYGGHAMVMVFVVVLVRAAFGRGAG